MATNSNSRSCTQKAYVLGLPIVKKEKEYAVALIRIKKIYKYS